MKLFIMVLSFILFSQLAVVKDINKRSFCDIIINNKKRVLKINGQSIVSYNLKRIKSILGKPTKTKGIKSQLRYEKWPAGKGVKISEVIEVSNYYYIYDNHGLIFTTNNLKPFSNNKNPAYLYIFFLKKREFSHDEKPKFFPKKKFTGKLKINDIIFDPSKKIIPDHVNDQRKKIELYHTTFAFTAYNRKIDSIYDYSGKPTIRIYFNNHNEKLVSYICVR